MAGPAGSAPAEIPADPGLPIPRDVHAGGHSYRAAVPSLESTPVCKEVVDTVVIKPSGGTG